MKKRLLGKTGLEIAPLGFGGMELRYCNSVQAKELLNTALDLGVNYVDTSPEYPTSEYYIGDHISKRRQEFFLATKCGDDLYSGAPQYSYSFDRKTCMRNLEDSLRLMKTDYIDVWQLHAVVPAYLKGGKCDDVIRCMQDARQQGKVRFLGATIRNGTAAEEGYPDRFGYESIEEFASWGVLDVIQLVYGGMTRTSERKIEAAVQKYGVGVIARGVVKKYRPWYDEAYERTRLWELFEEGETRTDFLIRYALSHPNLSGMVVGTKSTEHFTQNFHAAQKGPLSPSVLAEARRRLEQGGFMAK